METPPQRTEGTVAWFDQLRTFVIVLVVNLHACVTYSHVGSWYTQEAPEPTLLEKLPFAFWQAHLQSFFMGILFLLSGALAHGSIERRGPAGFARGRLLRLGVPCLLYTLVLHPFIVFVLNPGGWDFGPLPAAYARFVIRGNFIGATGPMWFAAALLFFSLALAGWRALRGAPAPRMSAAPGPAAIAAWSAAMVAATFLTRTVQPIGTSVSNMQLCYFPQYVFAFATGVAAARGGWFQDLARSPLARRAGLCALVLGPVGLACALVYGGVLRGLGITLLSGGWNGAALAYAAWEQLTGTALALGCLAFFSGRMNRTTPRSRWLSDRSFGVYLFHPVVLVAATLALRALGPNPYVKCALLTAAGLAGSFLVADAARRVPYLRTVV